MVGLEIENNIEMKNSLGDKLKNLQENFIESDIGKAINSAIDIGLKAVLPDLIEDQVIDVKNAILENGFSEGIKEVIDSAINTGKSAIGIITGNFENVSQIQLAVKNGGILDKVSDLLDYTIDFAKEKNVIDKNISSLIKNGKNSIIKSVEENIEETLTNQIKAVEKVEKYCNNWNIGYASQDITAMNKAYKNIKNNLEKIVPIENIINKARTIENLHNLIKNNGNSFDLTKEEELLAEKLA